jgi:hypothetical protein
MRLFAFHSITARSSCATHDGQRIAAAEKVNQQQAHTIEKMTAHIAKIEDESRRVDEALFKMTRVTDRIDGRAETMDQVPTR